MGGSVRRPVLLGLILLPLLNATSQTWVQRITAFATVLGDALSPNPLNSDIIYGAPGGRQLYISRDRGYTWHAFGTAVPHVGNVNADNVITSIAVDPLDTHRFVLGDFSSGIWETYDYGRHWKLVYSTNGEIPCIAIDPFNPRRMHASKYSGGGGIVYSTDWGENWQQLNTPISPMSRFLISLPIYPKTFSTRGSKPGGYW